MGEEEVGERNSEPYTAVRRKYRLDRSIGSRVKTRDRERGLCWMGEREMIPRRDVERSWVDGEEKRERKGAKSGGKKKSRK